MINNKNIKQCFSNEIFVIFLQTPLKIIEMVSNINERQYIDFPVKCFSPDTKQIIRSNALLMSNCF